MIHRNTGQNDERGLPEALKEDSAAKFTHYLMFTNDDSEEIRHF